MSDHDDGRLAAGQGEYSREPTDPHSAGSADAAAKDEGSARDLLKPQPPPLTHGERWPKQRSYIERMLGQEPGVVLARIINDKVLLVYDMVINCMRDQAFLLDPSRSYERALREVAFDISLADAKSLHPEFLRASVGRSLAWLINQDAETVRDSTETKPSESSRESFLSRAFGTPRECSLSASVDFHKLPRSVRRAFFALVIDERSVAECVRLGMGDRDELLRNCSVAIRTLGTAAQGADKALEGESR